MPLPIEPSAIAPMSTDPEVALNAGVTAADPARAEEVALAQDLMRKINRTLAFDEGARREYVRCRRYARGDSGFVVDANIVGTNIDLIEAFTYSKNPDVDVTPAKAVEMPSQEVMLEAAMELAENDPRVQQAVQQATQQAMLAQVVGPPPPVADPATGQVMPSPTPEQMVETARAAAIQAIAAENYAKIKAEYQRRTRENKAYADTGELVIASMWGRGRLKDRGRPWVRSGLTTGVGVLKASWQQRTAPSPETTTAINDLVQQQQRITALTKDIEDPEQLGEHKAKLEELRMQLQALRNQTEPVVSRGFVIDKVAPENFVVAPGFTIADHMDAPWNAECIPMEFDEAVATLKLNKRQAQMLTKYVARKPIERVPESANLEQVEYTDPRLAEQFVKGDADAFGEEASREQTVTNGVGCFVMLWEFWDRVANTVYTMLEGLQGFAKPAWNPCPTTRFYPYFLFCTSEVDGQRHPQSPVARSAKLVDEYNRIGSAEAKHRRRIIPKTAFNGGALANGEAEKLEKADIQEMVALKLTNPQTDIRTILMPISYAAIDPALYDRNRIMNEIERIWGTSEALSGAQQTTIDKTATQVETENQGFQARTGSRRDAIESTLTHLAQYTLEVARKYLSYEEVRDIAGPNAFWPPYDGAEDLRKMLDVEVRAGSTGKPNTAQDQRAWSMAMPHLERAISTFAQLMQSNPKDVAESYKKMATITCQVAGVRVDVDSLFPPPGQPAVDPVTGQPMPPGGAAGAGVPGEKPPGGGEGKSPSEPKPNAPAEAAAAADPAGDLPA